ncbi:phospholipase A [Sulfurimonas sp.]
MKKFIVGIFIILFSAMTLMAASIEYDAVYKKYLNGDYEDAFKEFHSLAYTNNDNDAAYMIAFMYEYGLGTPKNKKLAAKWYKIASVGYFQKSQHSLNKELAIVNDKLYQNLQKIQDKDTRKTLYQYVHSIFNMKAYDSNYLLPISSRLNGDYDMAGRRDTKSTEVEFQISIKYDFLPNLLGLDEVYCFAYTQHSFWQYYVGDAYFRESNYNPKFFVTLPIKNRYLKAARFAVEHESNGLGLPYERAWNFLSLSTYFQYKVLFTEVEVWKRLPDNKDYNPDLLDYLGYGHIRFRLPYKKNLFSVLLRHGFQGRGAIDASYSHPIVGDGLFLFVKAFAGYGESLIDYNHYVEKIGIGVSLSR